MTHFDFSIYHNQLKKDIELILQKLIRIDHQNNILKIQYLPYFTDDNKEINNVEATSAAIKEELSKIIYHTYYKRRKKDNYPDTNFSDILESSININNREFEDGWLVDKFPINEYGDIIVNKNLYSRKLIFAGNFLTNELVFPINDFDRVKIRGKQDIKNSNENDLDFYYYFYGNHIPDDYSIDESFIRFYLNLNIEINDFVSELSKLVSTLRLELNKRFIPFVFKVLNNKMKYTNADNFVLYIEKRYFFSVIDLIIGEINSKFAYLLRDEVPMFTYHLTNGIGFSEEPKVLDGFNPLFSFGEQRSLIIANAIIDVFLENKNWKDFDLIKNSISAFAKKNEGIAENLDEFFLNENSNFFYPSFAAFSLRNQVQNNGLILKIAKMTGYKLCSEAIWDGNNRCTWITVKDGAKAPYITINNSLLEGLSGIVLYLVKAKNILNEELFTRFFYGSSKCLFIKIADKLANNKILHGFYLGELMSIYIIKKYCSNIIDEKREQLFTPEHIINSLKNDHEIVSINMESGLSGTLVSLLYLYKLESNIIYLKEAISYGKKILSICSKDGNFICKDCEIGMPKGTSGIGFSLLALYKILNENKFEILEIQEFESIGIRAIEYENKFKKKPLGAGYYWKDEFIWKWDTMIGVYVSRKALNNLKYKAIIKNDLDDAFKFLIDKVLPIVSDQGNTLFNFVHSEVFFYNESSTTQLSEKLNQKLFEEIQKDILLIDNKNQILEFSGNFMQKRAAGFNPSIIDGFSGLGYTALRLLDPDLPSILVPNTEFSL